MKTYIGASALVVSFGALVWSSPGLAQGTIYKWVDSHGTPHYSNTPTGEAHAIDDELPPAASFGTPAASPSPVAEVPPSGTLPSDKAQARVQNKEADSVDPEGYSPAAGDGEFEEAVLEEDFALGQDGPFGTVESDNGGDEAPLNDC